MRLVGRVVVHHGVNDLPGRKSLKPVLDRDDFAAGWKNRADANEIELCDPRVAQCELERSEFLAMPADALGQKNSLTGWTHLILFLESDFVIYIEQVQEVCEITRR